VSESSCSVVSALRNLRIYHFRIQIEYYVRSDTVMESRVCCELMRPCDMTPNIVTKPAFVQLFTLDSGGWHYSGG
jgi:hypothetical protein